MKRTPSAGSDPSAAPRGWILVVDDDPVSTLIARHILENQGFVVECRSDALSGLERAQGLPTPDVVLFDIEMPGMNGIEACRRLRGLEGLAGVPAMLCSAQAKEQFLAEGLSAGANDYLEKPYTEMELVARVENLARMARYQQSLRDTLEQVRRNNEMLGLEMEAARRVQGALLPTTLTPHPSLRSAVLYEPMVGVGGDFYDVSLGADGMVRLLVADVSGHGVFAALLAAFFKMGYQVYSDREQRARGRAPRGAPRALPLAGLGALRHGPRGLARPGHRAVALRLGRACAGPPAPRIRRARSSACCPPARSSESWRRAASARPRRSWLPGTDSCFSPTGSSKRRAARESLTA